MLVFDCLSLVFTEQARYFSRSSIRHAGGGHKILTAPVVDNRVRLESGYLNLLLLYTTSDTQNLDFVDACLLYPNETSAAYLRVGSKH